jgi:hypothetical protein
MRNSKGVVDIDIDECLKVFKKLRKKAASRELADEDGGR